MTAPISLTEAKTYLRVDGDVENELIATLLGSALERIARHTGLDLATALPAPIRHAALILTAHAYENRGDDTAPAPDIATLVRSYVEPRL